MFKSQQSFNRMDESTASELQSLGAKPRANGTAQNGNHLSVYPPAPNGKQHTKTNGHPSEKREGN
jgi:hypothetical protein